MTLALWGSIQGTIVIWVMSAALAIVLGLFLAAGSLSSHRVVHLLARTGVNSTRGVPTSVLVIMAGMGMLRLSNTPELPYVYPGTPAAFQHIAWGIVLALAFGSAGHLAEIFAAARSTLGQYRLEQMAVMGLSRLGRTALLVRECAAVALPPTGARMVHHLHNTAFAALFPVTDLFGFVQGQSSSTFRVFESIMIGCVTYVALSGLIWLATRGLETIYASPAPGRAKRRRVFLWS